VHLAGRGSRWRPKRNCKVRARVIKPVKAKANEGVRKPVTKGAVMSENSGSPEQRGHAGGSSVWVWLLPVGTFLLGALLAGLVVGAGSFGGGEDGSGGAEEVAEPESTTASENPGEAGSTEGDVAVVIPRACLEAAENAEAAARQVDELVSAVREFDARALEELVDRFQKLQGDIERSGRECRDAAGGRLQDGRLIMPLPTVSTTPSPAR
jgi:hypothetical protein